MIKKQWWYAIFFNIRIFTNGNKIDIESLQSIYLARSMKKRNSIK